MNVVVFPFFLYLISLYNDKAIFYNEAYFEVNISFSKKLFDVIRMMIIMYFFIYFFLHYLHLKHKLLKLWNITRGPSCGTGGV